MSIHPVGGPMGFEPSSNQFFLQTQYNDQYMAFIKNPTPKQALKFEAFLVDNKSGLTTLANQVGYEPSERASWSSELQGLLDGLQNYIVERNPGILPSIYELSGDCATWIGIGQNPTDIVQAVDVLIQSFAEDPNVKIGGILQWVLSTPGYTDALITCSNNPNQTKADLNVLQQELAIYHENPNSSEIQQDVITSLQNLQNTLNP
ncbi:MAG: hypothetical protein HY860_04880 [Chlamydiales bacterium]|nr:hypothetical protein [Chlamydiales bacterium]